MNREDDAHGKRVSPPDQQGCARAAGVPDTPQSAEGSYAPLVTEAERRLNWNRSTTQLCNQLRASLLWKSLALFFVPLFLKGQNALSSLSRFQDSSTKRGESTGMAMHQTKPSPPFRSGAPHAPSPVVLAVRSSLRGDGLCLGPAHLCHASSSNPERNTS
jgi:hypothetical protein